MIQKILFFLWRNDDTVVRPVTDFQAIQRDSWGADQIIGFGNLGNGLDIDGRIVQKAGFDRQ